MSALAVIVVGGDIDRAFSALALAGCSAARGDMVTMLFDRAAVALLADPALGDALTTVQALGVTVSACATGVVDATVALPDGIAAGGMMMFLAAADGARLVAV